MKFIFYLFLFCFLYSSELFSQSCKCDHSIQASELYVDASKLNIKGGDTICLMSGEKKYFQLKNFHGDSLAPITFINCGGEVLIRNKDFHYGFMISNCKYFRLTGTGDTTISKYGIKIDGTGPGASGLSIAGLSSNFEIDHVEASHTGFAGIMSKSDPSCDGSSNRGVFVQRNVSFHDNYIHDVKGEGMYIGNSFYSGWKANNKCKGTVLYPHDIIGLRIFSNIIEGTDWDGIQVGCASSDAEIYNNSVRFYGLSGVAAQSNGIQIGEGTTGKLYNNTIRNGKGNGIILLGLGDNYVFDNLIMNAGEYGIFSDDRVTKKESIILVTKNTIVNSKKDPIKINNKVTNNIVTDNIIK